MDIMDYEEAMREFTRATKINCVEFGEYTDDEVWAWAGRMRHLLPDKAFACCGLLAERMLHRVNRKGHSLDFAEGLFAAYVCGLDIKTKEALDKSAELS
jgi:hypothetical protein